MANSSKSIYDLQTRTKSLEVECKELRKYIESVEKTEPRYTARTIKTYQTEAKKELSTLKDLASSFQNEHKKLKALRYKSEVLQEKANSLTDIDGRLEELNARIDNTAETRAKFDELVASIETYLAKAETIDETAAKVKEHNSVVLKLRSDIRNVHNEIYGYDEEGENGEKVHVQGIKQELNEAFQDTASQVEGLDEKLSEKLEAWDSETNELFNKINRLLPGATTAGLSSAYALKSVREKKNRHRFQLIFYIGLFLIACVSAIPVYVGIDSILDGNELDTVLERTPRLALTLLPLYVPLVWWAYSSSKKSNLSKRLEEEYTHKEVTAKTFEGLSRSIKNEQSDEVSEELKVRLIYNLLQVNSENPGKLISDYNTSDHPVMDALEKSVKLANAIDKLSDIPGLSKIVNILERKRTDALKETNKKAEQVLEEDVK